MCMLSIDGAGSADKPLLDTLHGERQRQINKGRVTSLRLKLGALGVEFSEADSADKLAERINLHYTKELELPANTRPIDVLFARIANGIVNDPGYRCEAAELTRLTQEAINKTMGSKD